MSLFEWLFDSQNPGPAGSIEEHENPQSTSSSIPVILYLLLAITALGIPFYLADFPTNWQQRWGLYLSIWIGEIIYLILGFFVNARPNTSNVGWFGGLIDNPFRISDDFNRFLAVLKIILLPGRLIGLAIMNFISLLSRSES